MKALLLFLATWLTLLPAAGTDSGKKSGSGAEHAKPGWKLVWSDEFDKPGALDPKKWAYETDVHRNNEKQVYTNDRRENVRVEDGNLILEARKERYDVPEKKNKHADYTAGSIETRGKQDWKYGRIEVKAKIPTGRGMWPAIWMMPTDGKGGWPACGEIDIMENVGFDPDTIHGTIHCKAYNHIKHTQKGGDIKVEKPYDSFHVYAVEWDETKVDFLEDDHLYYTFKNDGKGDDGTWPFDKPFYLKINTAIGGDWGGQKGLDDSIFPQKFYIDYVRVYQKAKP